MYRIICVIIIVAATILDADAQAATAHDELKQFIFDLATARHDDDADDPKEKQLLDFAQRRGIHSDLVKAVLLGFAKGDNLPPDHGDRISEFSLWLLGRYRASEALDVYRDRLGRNNLDSLTRRSYLIGLSRIDSPAVLDILQSVIQNQADHAKIDRYAIYEELGAHLPVEASNRDALREFLIKAAQTETYAGGVIAIDKSLAASDEHYRTSEERSDILRKHLETDQPAQRRYFQEELTGIERSK